MIDEQTRNEIRRIQSDAEARIKAEKLPSYVKCMYCGCRPSWGNLLGVVIPNTTALACEKCLLEHGKLMGLNTGTIPELTKGDNNDSTPS